MKKVLVVLLALTLVTALGYVTTRDIDASGVITETKRVVDDYKNRGTYYTQEEINKMLEIHKQEVIRDYKEQLDNDMIQLEMRLEKQRLSQRSTCN